MSPLLKHEEATNRSGLAEWDAAENCSEGPVGSKFSFETLVGSISLPFFSVWSRKKFYPDVV